MPLPSESEYIGSESTLLRMMAVGLPPFAARGLTQTFAPIDGAKNTHRTINGELADFSFDQFRKYASTISATDQQAPGLDGIWPGMEVVVECAAELSYVTAGGSPSRPVVPGSSRTEGAFTFYRPILVMRVMNFDDSFVEWEASRAWSMTLEEI